MSLQRPIPSWPPISELVKPKFQHGHVQVTEQNKDRALSYFKDFLCMKIISESPDLIKLRWGAKNSNAEVQVMITPTPASNPLQYCIKSTAAFKYVMAEAVKKGFVVRPAPDMPDMAQLFYITPSPQGDGGQYDVFLGGGGIGHSA